jgi:hypothetical protein
VNPVNRAASWGRFLDSPSSIIHHSHIHVAESDREPLMISHPNENHTMKDIK